MSNKVFKDFWVFRNGVYYHKEYELLHISKEEHDRFYKTFELPITDYRGAKNWFNEEGFYHNLIGPTIITKDRSLELFEIDGINYSEEEWLEKRKVYFLKKIIFSRKNKNTLKKLLYIPELYQSVFYDNKELFISLLQKL